MNKEFPLLFLVVALLVQVQAQQINYTYNGQNGAGGVGEYGIVTQANSGQATLGAEGVGDVYANLNLGSNMSGTRRFWHISKRTSDQNHSLQFYYYDGATFKYPSVTFLPNGNTGFGTISPNAKIHIAGNNSSYTGADLALARTSTNGNVGNGVTIQLSDEGSNNHNIIQGSSAGLQFFNCCGSGGWSERMRIQVDGNVGIGTASPSFRLQVKSSNPVDRISIQGTNANDNVGFMIQNQDGSERWSIAAPYDRNMLQFFNGSHGNVMVLGETGNVGIGTTTPDAKLTVNGTIHSKEVKVDLNVPGPDYVFEKDYHLPSLEQIKSYIDQNKHLPEVPSAKEMGANGVNLGEMNMILLKKIEELTLYAIEQNKKIEMLEKRSVSPDTSGKKVEELMLYVIRLNEDHVEQQLEIEKLKKKLYEKN